MAEAREGRQYRSGLADYLSQAAGIKRDAVAPYQVLQAVTLVRVPLGRVRITRVVRVLEQVVHGVAARHLDQQHHPEQEEVIGVTFIGMSL